MSPISAVDVARLFTPAIKEACCKNVYIIKLALPIPMKRDTYSHPVLI